MVMVKSNEPKIDLKAFFLSISSAAFIGLGMVPPLQGGSLQIDLAMAQQNIDLLELMEEKTRGNRTPEEDQLVGRLLVELRMKFIEKSKNKV